MSHLLRLPDLQHRHTSNDRVGIFLGGWVHGIIGTDHQSQVRLWSDTQQSNIRKHLDSFSSCFSGFICCSLCLHDVIILLLSQLTAHYVTHVSSPLNNGNTDHLSTSTACQSNKSHPVFEDWRDGAQVMAHLVGDCAWRSRRGGSNIVVEVYKNRFWRKIWLAGSPKWCELMETYATDSGFTKTFQGKWTAVWFSNMWFTCYWQKEKYV